MLEGEEILIVFGHSRHTLTESRCSEFLNLLLALSLSGCILIQKIRTTCNTKNNKGSYKSRYFRTVSSASVK